MAETGGCASPTGKALGQNGNETPPAGEQTVKEEDRMAVKVGKKAPDFEAPAYHQGKFITVKLSESLGHWILLCFYPGDYTFV